MNRIKRLLCSGFILSFFLVMTGCEKPIEDLVEDKFEDTIVDTAYKALGTFKSVKVDYEMIYNPGGDVIKRSSVYIFNDPMIQAGFWANDKLDSIIYVHEDDIYRVSEYEGDHIYEDYPFIEENHWKLNKIILNKNLIEDEFTTTGNIQTYPVTIAATQLINDYPTLADMIKGFQDPKNEKTNPVLNDVNVDFTINIDIETKRIVSIEADLLDYLVAHYEKNGSNMYYDIPTIMQIKLTYDEIDIPDLIWEDMIADDASMSVDGKHHIIQVGQVTNTKIQYLYDTDLLVLTVDEQSFYRMTSPDDVLPNVLVRTSSGDIVEFEVSDTVSLDPGIYYFYVSRWQIGDVSLLIEKV